MSWDNDDSVKRVVNKLKMLGFTGMRSSYYNNKRRRRP
jgi:hypothetical protein